MTQQKGRPLAQVSGPSGANSTLHLEVDRILAKLRDADANFTRQEVAYLMSRSYRSGQEAEQEEPSRVGYRAGFEDGYRSRVAEENAAYPPAPVKVLGRDYDQVQYRRRCDEEASKARPNDYRGGPVSWEAAR